jgi:transcriptional regulator with XRE-family HTH domain
LTQEQLGEEADIDYKYLGGIERGERNPFTQNLAKIAAALEVNLKKLFVFEHEIEETRELKKKLMRC